MVLTLTPLIAGGEVGEVVRPRYQHLGVNPVTYLSEFTQPQAAQYLAYLALQGGFLAYFAPAGLLLLLPGIAQNVLANIDFPIRLTGVYYSGISITALYAAAVFGYKKVREQRPELSSTLLTLFISQAIVVSLIASPTPYSLAKTWTDFRPYPDWPAMQRILARIPPDASVATQNNVAAHVARREVVVEYPAHTSAVDYILLHVHDPTAPTDRSPFFFFGAPSRRDSAIMARYREEVLEAAFREKDFGILAYENTWYLFKRGHSREGNEAALEQARQDLEDIVSSS
jgi:hypothetical protein